MGKKIRQCLSIMLVFMVACAFVLAGVFFTILLLFLWGVLELCIMLASRTPKGTIVTKGQVIAVDYTVLDEKIISDKKKHE